MRPQILKLATISLISTIVGLILSTRPFLDYCEQFVVCEKLSWTLAETIGLSALSFGSAFLILLLIQYFLRDQVFTAWWKFSRIYLIIALGLILLTDSQPTGGLLGGDGPDRETVIWFTSSIFLLISLLLIAWKAVKLRKTPA